jgi:ABC-type multidrug transport system ATPase subunit
MEREVGQIMTLAINNLSKMYVKNVYALNNFTYTFSPGIYGLLGPNGAGKSTFMNIISMNLSITEGTCFYNGDDIKKLGGNYRSKIGFMPQQNGVYETFTLLRFLRYIANLKGIKKPDSQIIDLVTNVNLKDNLHQKVGSFSGGMRQRALVAQALLGTPELLILDEPTAGLDPKERVRLREFIQKESEKKIVIWSTHVISDIESISKEVLFIRKGHLIESINPNQCQQPLEDIYMSIFGEENEV